MADAWFSNEIARNLVWLSLLSYLSLLWIPVKRGLYRTPILSVWIVAITFGALCLTGFAAGLILEQPRFVLLPLLVLGTALTVTFGATLKALIEAYREVETRRSIAQDI